MAVLEVLIVEDEPACQQKVLEYCRRHPRLKVTGTVSTARDFLSHLLEQRYDLVIMDIELRDAAGTRAMRQTPCLPPVVISTGHPKYAVEAFELGVVDFLLKPYTFERFTRSIDRVIAASEGFASDIDPRSRGVSIKTGEDFFFIPFDEIVFIARQPGGSNFRTIRTDYQSPGNLETIASKLPEKQFLRVHEEFILNVSFVSHLQHLFKGDYVAYLKDLGESQIPISRFHSEELKGRLGL